MAKRQDLVTLVITTSTYIGSSTIPYSPSTSSSQPDEVPPTTIPSQTTLSSATINSLSSSTPRISSTTPPISTSTNSPSTSSTHPSSLPLGSPNSFDPLIHSKTPSPTPYNPTTLIVASVLIGLILIAVISWFIRRRIRRKTQRDLETLANNSTEDINGGGGGGVHGYGYGEGEVYGEKRVEEGGGRRSAVGETFVRPMSIMGSEEHLLGGDQGGGGGGGMGVGGGMVDNEMRRKSLAVSVNSMRESVIGVATTTSLPVSSSKSAVCEDYPDRKSAGEAQANKSRRKPAPSDPGLLSASFVPMSQMDNRKTYRSPTESIYACYEDELEEKV